MGPFGAQLLQLAFGICLVGSVCGLLGIFTRRHDLAGVARNAVYASCLAVVLATLVLLQAFLNHDFELAYVWQNSSVDMEVYYLVTALWGGHSGSLLFWSAVLAVYSAGVAFFHRRERQGMLLPAVHVVLLVIQGFLLYLLAWLDGSQPFLALEVPAGMVVTDGKGLNPLLQDPVMAIHPPCLYLGFVGLAVPFAFAMGALISGRLGTEWLKLCRVWTLIAWNFLTMGIILGGFWAYRELGWGGYWAWDPVENSSFMPWLAATAFLHSVIVSEKYGMLRVWNMILIWMAFALTIFGTFLTRSGFLTSVHTFAENEAMFNAFGGFLIASLVIWFGLVAFRWRRLKSDGRMESFFSREFMFLGNNLVLVALTVIVLVFTLWPNITDRIVTNYPDFAARHELEKQTIGATAYNKWTSPFFLLLVLLTGLGTATSWKKTSADRLLRAFTLPVSAALLSIGLSIVLLPVLTDGGWTLDGSEATGGGQVGFNWTHLKATASFGLVAFLLVSSLQEFVIGVRARRRAHPDEGFATALALLFSKNHRRYGGYLVHVGVVFIVFGITTHQCYQLERSGTVGAETPMVLGGYEMHYLDWEEGREESYQYVAARVRVVEAESGREVGTARTEKRSYFARPEQWMTEVGWVPIHGGTANVYVVLAGTPNDQRIPMQVYINPMVNVIWLGSLLMVVAGWLVVFPWNRIGRILRQRRASGSLRRERQLEQAISARRREVS